MKEEKHNESVANKINLIFGKNTCCMAMTELYLKLLPKRVVRILKRMLEDLLISLKFALYVILNLKIKNHKKERILIFKLIPTKN